MGKWDLDMLQVIWTIATDLVKPLCFIFLSFCSLVVDSLVTCLLWNWFLSPLGISIINVFHAAGILLFFEILNSRYTDIYVKRDNPQSFMVLGFIFYRPLLLVLVGLILRSFI